MKASEARSRCKPYLGRGDFVATCRAEVLQLELDSKKVLSGPVRQAGHAHHSVLARGGWGKMRPHLLGKDLVLRLLRLANLILGGELKPP